MRRARGWFGLREGAREVLTVKINTAEISMAKMKPKEISTVKTSTGEVPTAKMKPKEISTVKTKTKGGPDRKIYKGRPWTAKTYKGEVLDGQELPRGDPGRPRSTKGEVQTEKEI